MGQVTRSGTDRLRAQAPVVSAGWEVTQQKSKSRLGAWFIPSQASHWKRVQKQVGGGDHCRFSGFQTHSAWTCRCSRTLRSWMVLSSATPPTEFSGLGLRGSGGTRNWPPMRAMSPQLRVGGGERGQRGDPGVSFGTHPVKMAAWCKYLQHLEGALLSQRLFELSFHKQLRQQQTQRLPRGRARVSGRFIGDARACQNSRSPGPEPLHEQRQVSSGPGSRFLSLALLTGRI